jgi:hypothetical protein
MRVLWTMLIGVALAGCGPKPPPPTDLAEGSALLKEVLTAWKDGKAMDGLPATVSDPDWTAGKKLDRFELTGDDKPSGYDLRCGARIWLDGAQEPKRVFFLVSLSPKKVVVRDMMGGG